MVMIKSSAIALQIPLTGNYHHIKPKKKENTIPFNRAGKKCLNIEITLVLTTSHNILNTSALFIDKQDKSSHSETLFGYDDKNPLVKQNTLKEYITIGWHERKNTYKINEAVGILTKQIILSASSSEALQLFSGIAFTILRSLNAILIRQVLRAAKW